MHGIIVEKTEQFCNMVIMFLNLTYSLHLEQIE
jgi:hypothetical protein